MEEKQKVLIIIIYLILIGIASILYIITNGQSIAHISALSKSIATPTCFKGDDGNSFTIINGQLKDCNFLKTIDKSILSPPFSTDVLKSIALYFIIFCNLILELLVVLFFPSPNQSSKVSGKSHSLDSTQTGGTNSSDTTENLLEKLTKNISYKDLLGYIFIINYFPIITYINLTYNILGVGCFSLFLVLLIIIFKIIGKSDFSTNKNDSQVIESSFFNTCFIFILIISIIFLIISIVFMVINKNNITFLNFPSKWYFWFFPIGLYLLIAGIPFALNDEQASEYLKSFINQTSSILLESNLCIYILITIICFVIFTMSNKENSDFKISEADKDKLDSNSSVVNLEKIKSDSLNTKTLSWILLFSTLIVLIIFIIIPIIENFYNVSEQCSILKKLFIKGGSCS